MKELQLGQRLLIISLDPFNGAEEQFYIEETIVLKIHSIHKALVLGKEFIGRVEKGDFGWVCTERAKLSNLVRIKPDEIEKAILDRMYNDCDVSICHGLEMVANTLKGSRYGFMEIKSAFIAIEYIRLNNIKLEEPLFR